MLFKSLEKITYNDIFQTPLIVCEYMVNLLPKNYHNKLILEPTPGKGNLVYVLKLKGYKKIESPTNFFYNYFNYGKFDAILMNPPFSGKYLNFDFAPAEIKKFGKSMKIGYWFLYKSMELSDIVIALMPFSTISDSYVRAQHIINFGLRSITVLPRRTFGYARIQTAIFHLIKGYNKSIEFKYFHTIQNGSFLI